VTHIHQELIKCALYFSCLVLHCSFLGYGTMQYSVEIINAPVWQAVHD